MIKDEQWKYHIQDLRPDTLKKYFQEAVKNLKEDLQSRSLGVVPGDGGWIWSYDGNNLEENQSRK